MGDLGNRASPVDRASSTLFFVKISMCSHERPGWPGYREISVTGMKIFPYEHSSPKWHNFGLVRISTLGVCELALLVKLQESTKL